jgi:non-specific serine/threonine protein kinase
VSLWRTLGDPAELQTALGHLVRSIAEPGAELDDACAQLQRSAAAGVASPRAELRVHGALAEAARVRGDHRALLACREQELRLARELGWNDMAQAAETNVCAALIELGRNGEAAERGAALLQRIDAAGSDTNGNLPWALHVLAEALVRLGEFAAVRAMVPRLLAADRRFGTGLAWQAIMTLVVAQEHFEAAGRLLGYVNRLWAARKDSLDLGEQDLLDRVTATVQARLGAHAAAALAAEGRHLDDEAAAALAAG